MQTPLALCDRRIVDAGESSPHQPLLVELPDSLPYDRYHCAESSCHSYSKVTAMRLSRNPHSVFLRR